MYNEDEWDSEWQMLVNLACPLPKTETAGDRAPAAAKRYECRTFVVQFGLLFIVCCAHCQMSADRYCVFVVEQ
jgi:hypothetical protein